MKLTAKLVKDSSGSSIRVTDGWGGVMEFDPETLKPFGPGQKIGSEWEAGQFQKAAEEFKNAAKVPTPRPAFGLLR